MKSREHAKPRPAGLIRWAVALMATLIVATASASAADRNFRLASSQSGASSVHLGAIRTHAGLRLVFKALCANVRVFTDAMDSVSYAVRLDQKLAGATPDSLRNFALEAQNTPRGVLLIAPSREGDCRTQVTYEIHVPRRYDLDIGVQAGDIVSQDIDGAVAFSTGGGEIRAGNIHAGDSAPKDAGNAAFLAHLQTSGGDICVGNVGGGLDAATRGGQISAGDVHGPAVLRTGGGDIHVGHVFGGARFTSGGGDIISRKVDGGLWADTAGGRVEIGDITPLPAVEPRFPAGQMDASAPPERGRVSADHTNESADTAQFARLFDLLFWGGIRTNPSEQQSRLIQAVAPEYPDVARLAGIEGDVVLRILVSRDGTVRDIDVVLGPPVLARAAMRAVEQWRYAPALVSGHPVDVISSVTLAFRLHP